ncbi:FG-GAP-like repeat-containing protein [Thalassoglobus sp.]|uniref:FG-GAP-like repeat-containing protein n=1 Tax=Thalassoglobus sp. TaxID=2795869 RepID=UPI003AA96F03
MKFYSILIAVLLLIVIGLLGFWFLAPINNVPPGNDSPEVTDLSKLTEEELLALAESRNLGIAELENHQWLESAERFRIILKTFPESALAIQNLAIAETSFFIGLDASAGKETTEASQKRAMESIQQLRKLHPDDPVSYRLEARVFEKQLQPVKAIELLSIAAKQTPDDPTIWYEIYRVSQSSRDGAVQESGREALNRLHELVPENVFATMQWVITTAQSDDPPLAELITELETLLTPLAPGIEKRSRYNVLTFLEKAKTSLESGNSAAAKSSLMPIKNIVTADAVSKNGLNELEENALEFIQIDFTKVVEELLTEVLQKATHDHIEVKYEPATEQVDISDAVQDLQIVDLNLNGRLEILTLSGTTFRGFGNASPSESWVEQFSVTLNTKPSQFIVADLDYELIETAKAEGETSAASQGSLQDVIFFGADGIQLFKTSLNPDTREIKLEAMPASTELNELKDVTRVVAADLNNDGDLDLAVVANGKLSCWNNQGNFEFKKIQLDENAREIEVVDSLAVDWDRDVDTDILVLLSDGSLGILENFRHGTFHWKPFGQKFSLGQGKSLELVDADRNGSWDILVGGTEGIEIFYTRVPKTGNVQFTKSETLSEKAAVSLLDLDFDNDGFRDLISVSSEGMELLRGTAAMKYLNANNVLTAMPESLHQIRKGDLDQDGDEDLAMLSDGEIRLFTNNGGNKNNWIDVSLLAAHVENESGSSSQRINHFGIGSTLELRVKAQFQKQLVRSPQTKFGIGSHPQADAVRILWTNGIPQNVIQPSANQLVSEVQKLSGSCPYLYTWNGNEFVFVTDLLWASPIGLQNPAGELVPARPWEYLKIPGEMLAEQDGKYKIRITEELWEIAYFDQVRLIAIDHPEEINIYSNEKVGPGSISEYKLHQVRNERLPASVVNHVGRDLIAEIRQQDDHYAKPFEKRLMQGYTDDSFIEIDFGLTEKPEQLTLFLTGWVRPTDTGLNVAIHENSQLRGPAPPSILAPNESGEFVETIPYCGFPGGKTKTIAIDLTEAFLTDDYRIRLATSMELYWDRIFFSTESLTDEYVSQKLTCTSAELHYRGVSGIAFGPNNAPEKFLYNETIQVTPWAAIDGKLTRYGDVRELIEESDHKLLVIGAGDEMIMEFDLPEEPLRPGWKRDFILHNVGWDKDANLHTVTGETVGPLPFVGMESYPYDHVQLAPHPQDYLETYQTRELPTEDFWSVLRRSSLDELKSSEPIRSN